MPRSGTPRFPMSACLTWYKDSTAFDDFDFTPFDYVVAGYEQCPTTGREHWQIFCQTHKQYTLNTGNQFFPGAHHDRAMASDYRESAGYCKKGYHSIDKPTDGWRVFFSRTVDEPGDWRYPVEYGTIKLNGKRKDLQDACEDIKAGRTTVRQIVAKNPDLFHTYGRTLERVEDMINEDKFRTEMPEVIWYYGPPGTGKSHTVYDGFDPRTMYNWKDDKGWWDGYRGQETVIINEFKGQISLAEMLCLCDKFPYEVRRRGRPPHPFLATKILITSSKHPVDYYQDTGESMMQLTRRITIVHLTEVRV